MNKLYMSVSKFLFCVDERNYSKVVCAGDDDDGGGRRGGFGGGGGGRGGRGGGFGRSGEIEIIAG